MQVKRSCELNTHNAHKTKKTKKEQTQGKEQSPRKEVYSDNTMCTSEQKSCLLIEVVIKTIASPEIT